MAAWLEYFQEKSSWYRNEHVCSLNSPTDWIHALYKTVLFIAHMQLARVTLH